MPLDEWPDPVNRAFKHINQTIYVPMQGPSELGASGKLVNWDRTADLANITVPTLVIGAQHDTMDPAHMEKMAGSSRRGRYLHCPNGSHLAMYDDQADVLQRSRHVRPRRRSGPVLIGFFEDDLIIRPIARMMCGESLGTNCSRRSPRGTSTRVRGLTSGGAALRTSLG